MAKSSRGGRRGAGAGGGITLAGGEKIEYDGELKYGKQDANMSATQRTLITSWENKRVKNKVEYAYALDEKGNVLGEAKGSKKQVRTPARFHDTVNSVFSHVHPRQDGILGGTFSNQDMYNFVKGNNKTFRATAKEGTYSISKGKNFDGQGFNVFMNRIDRELRAKHKVTFYNLAKDYYAKKITYEGYSKGYAKTFNSYLVERHNEILKAQKQYGYSYTLERR